MENSASLQALLASAIDYAGLFPPTKLALEPALRNQAAYLRDQDAGMLGAFVLPIAKFEEASGLLSKFSGNHRLRVSALGAKTENATHFMDALQKGATAIHEFNTRQSRSAVVTQIEVALPSQPGVHLADANALLADLNLATFWEAAPDEAERTIGFLAERAPSFDTFGFKLRTGGVIASAFPSSIQIARALVAAVSQQVPIKFTAGLHHPIRQFHPSVQAKMHGFVNVLGAGVMAAEHDWDVQQTARMLEDEDPSGFSFDEDGFTWTTWQIPTERITVHRKIVTSFGSCSFDEPREDLRALQLL
ncbi:MAG: hypothetical protein ABI992_00060 [Chthoniobacterales bacterium]